MRVCFDSLCFSSTQQQRLADEEDATTQFAAASATSVPVITPQHLGGYLVQPVSSMGSPRDIQDLLRDKDSRIAELEAQLCLRNGETEELLHLKDELERQLCLRNSEIQELRSHLDKFLSVLPFKSPLKPEKSRPRKQRAQGISAEPPLEEPALLVVVEKSDRLVLLPRDFITFYFQKEHLTCVIAVLRFCFSATRRSTRKVFALERNASYCFNMTATWQ